jgi:hypothetical protein
MQRAALHTGMVATAALSTCDHCDFPNTKCNGAKTTVLSGSTWIDTTARLKWGLPYKAIIEVGLVHAACMFPSLQATGFNPCTN